MRKFIQYLFRNPVKRMADRFSSNPKLEAVHYSLTRLYASIIKKENKRGIIIEAKPDDKFIVFSDLHKGAKNGSDDFRKAEPNYLHALNYYQEQGFCYINLGDSEELWENTFYAIQKHNKGNFEAEKKFIALDKFYKVFGNHDVYWNKNVNPLAPVGLKIIYGKDVPVYEGLILKYENQPAMLLTHGHQGDGQSDGNAFSAWFVSNIWAPLQSYLELNPNTPSSSDTLKTTHNKYMYEWAALQKNLFLITGHTHQPVFESLTHLERLFRTLYFARATGNKNLEAETTVNIEQRNHKKETKSEADLQIKPSYFNTGCCCFDDGDITGIEIDADSIRLIKWSNQDSSINRIILEQNSFANLSL